MSGTTGKTQDVELNCCLCACKHVARAEALLSEAKLGYPENFWRCLANLSLAEDHVVQNYPAFSDKLRKWRKDLEYTPTLDVPWADLINECALLENYDIGALWPKQEPYAGPCGFT